MTIVTQTCVRPERAEAFARWQGETSTAVAGFPGFIEQRLLPPNPPLQVDWVILQRFASSRMPSAGWLRRNGRSASRASRRCWSAATTCTSCATARAPPAAPVSAVISTRVKPGKEAEYRAWERSIAAAQSKAPGLQGYRFEPPVPGVQEDCVAYPALRQRGQSQRLDGLARAQGSCSRRRRRFTEEFHARIARTGFDHWFRDASRQAAPAPAAWKMNMIVLLLLYPIVFLFGFFVQTPVSARLSAAVRVALVLRQRREHRVPRLPGAAGGQPHGLVAHTAGCPGPSQRILGAAPIVVLYATLVVVFSRLF